MQSPGQSAGHPIGMHAAPPIAAESCLNVICAHRPHAVAKFSEYECVPMSDVINLLCLGLPTVLLFQLGCCFLANSRGLQSSPCLRLTSIVPR